MTLRTKLELAVISLFIVLLSITSIRLDRTARAFDAASNTRDSLLIQTAADGLTVAGWEVAFADMRKNLSAELARKDTLSKQLARSLRDANAQVRSLTELVVALQDSAASVGTQDTTTQVWRGTFNDSLLTGSWTFLAPDLRLTYGVTVPLEIVTSEAGDGRILLTARSRHPHATLTIESFLWQPPAPIIQNICTTKQKGAWLAIGAGFSLLLRG